MITDLRINEKGELEGKLETPQWDEMYTKDDMVATLKFLWNDIEDLDGSICDYASSDCIFKWQVHELIQQIINDLKGGEDGTN